MQYQPDSRVVDSLDSDPAETNQPARPGRNLAALMGITLPALAALGIGVSEEVRADKLGQTTAVVPGMDGNGEILDGKEGFAADQHDGVLAQSDLTNGQIGLLAGIGVLAPLIGVLAGLKIRSHNSRKAAHEVCDTFGRALAEASRELRVLEEKKFEVLGRQITDVKFEGSTLEKAKEIFSLLKKIDVVLKDGELRHEIIRSLIREADQSFLRSQFGSNNYKMALEVYQAVPAKVDRDSELAAFLKQGRQALTSPVSATVNIAELDKHSCIAMLVQIKTGFDIISSELEDFEKRVRTAADSLSGARKAVDESTALVADVQKLGSSHGMPPLTSYARDARPWLESTLRAALDIAAADPLKASTSADAVLAVTGAGQAALKALRGAFDPDNSVAMRIFAAEKALEESIGKNPRWIRDEFGACFKSVDAFFASVPTNREDITAPNIFAALANLNKRCEQAHEINLELRGTVTQALKHANDKVLGIQSELVDKLSLSADQVLHEVGNDPFKELANAGLLVAETVPGSLTSGDLEAAHSGLAKVIALSKRATEIAQESLQFTGQYAARRVGVLEALSKFDQHLPEYKDMLERMRERYDAAVLRLGAGDPAHPGADGTIENNIEETTVGISRAKELLNNAEELYSSGALLESEAALSRAEATQELVSLRLNEINEKNERVKLYEEKNERELDDFNKALSEMYENMRRPATRGVTIKEYEATRESVLTAQLLHERRNGNPFIVAERLESIGRDIKHLEQAVKRDHELYYEAVRSIKAANTSVQEAGKKLQAALSDAAGESKAILTAQEGLKALSEQLAKVTHDAAEVHFDWEIIDREADRIECQAANYAATLSNEVNAALSATIQLAKAKDSIGDLRNWEGLHGITISKDDEGYLPGQRKLAQGKCALEDGKYSEAKKLAEQSLNESKQALEQARSRAEQIERERTANIERERLQRAQADANLRLKVEGGGRSDEDNRAASIPAANGNA